MPNLFRASQEGQLLQLQHSPQARADASGGGKHVQGIGHVQREKDRPHPLPEGTRILKGSQPKKANASLGWKMIPALGLEPTQGSGGTREGQRYGRSGMWEGGSRP